MISVMIVDDEVDILYGAQLVIDWNELGFELCKLCHDSEQALEAFREQPCDLVITDIRMPKIDGLSLVAEIKKCSPRCRIIILSGYDDFAYAKEAIKLGVSEYLLKPLDAEELESTLLRLRGSITGSGADDTPQEGRVDDALRHKLFGRLLFGDTGEQNEREHELFALLSQDSYRLVMAMPDSPFVPGDMENTAFETFYKKLAIALKNRGVLRFQQMFEETAVFIVDASLANDMLKGAVDNAPGKDAGTFSIAVSPPLCELNFLKDCYTRLKKLLNNDILFEKPGGVYFYSSFTTLDVLPPFYDIDFATNRRLLHEAMLSIDGGAVPSLLEGLAAELRARRRHLPSERVRLFWRMLSVAAGEILRDSFQADKSTLEDFSYGCELIEHLPSMEAIAGHLAMLIFGATHSLGGIAWQKTSAMIKRIILHVEAGASGDISLGGVARQFFINPSYLSRMFREKTGKNFWVFVTEVRLKKARAMLENESHTLEGIALECGFKNVKTLYAAFKKHLGFTPGEYRRRHVQGGAYKSEGDSLVT